MEIIGKLIEKRDQRQASQTFVVREFVIEVENPRDPRYNDFLQCQLTGDRCALLDQYQIGDTIQITFDLRGRKWTAPDNTIRYIMSINVWRIDRPQYTAAAAPQGAYQQQPYQQPVQPVAAAPQPAAAPQQPAPAPADSPADDLPF